MLGIRVAGLSRELREKHSRMASSDEVNYATFFRKDTRPVATHSTT
jgi:hypothetical protein